MRHHGYLHCQCCEIAALDHGFHCIEVHFLHTVKKIFNCLAWLLSLIEIETCTSANDENQDQNENNQPGMSFLLPFVIFPPALEHNRSETYYVKSFNFISATTFVQM